MRMLGYIEIRPFRVTSYYKRKDGTRGELLEKRFTLPKRVWDALGLEEGDFINFMQDEKGRVWLKVDKGVSP